MAVPVTFAFTLPCLPTEQMYPETFGEAPTCALGILETKGRESFIQEQMLALNHQEKMTTHLYGPKFSRKCS